MQRYELQEIYKVNPLDAHKLERDLESRSKEIDQEDLLLGLQANARFRSWDLCVMGPPRFRCATLFSNKDFTIVQALKSGYVGPRLSEYNPTST